mmetsp:Transcript_9705/g.25118  ORF Transcript_9705/g.25118 Transcript_9705/m.25118 type:complete len:445 (+) Transcript_9705:490-1824(+)
MSFECPPPPPPPPPAVLDEPGVALRAPPPHARGRRLARGSRRAARLSPAKVGVTPCDGCAAAARHELSVGAPQPGDARPSPPALAAPTDSSSSNLARISRAAVAVSGSRAREPPSGAVIVRPGAEGRSLERSAVGRGCGSGGSGPTVAPGVAVGARSPMAAAKAMATGEPWSDGGDPSTSLCSCSLPCALARLAFSSSSAAGEPPATPPPASCPWPGGVRSLELPSAPSVIMKDEKSKVESRWALGQPSPRSACHAPLSCGSTSGASKAAEDGVSVACFAPPSFPPCPFPLPAPPFALFFPLDESAPCSSVMKRVMSSRRSGVSSVHAASCVARLAIRAALASAFAAVSRLRLAAPLPPPPFFVALGLAPAPPPAPPSTASIATAPVAAPAAAPPPFAPLVPFPPPSAAFAPPDFPPLARDFFVAPLAAPWPASASPKAARATE